MMDELTTINTTEWTKLVRENAYMKKALEHLISIYHKSIEEKAPGVPFRDITDVIEISEIEKKEVEVIV